VLRHLQENNYAIAKDPFEKVITLENIPNELRRAASDLGLQAYTPKNMFGVHFTRAFKNDEVMFIPNEIANSVKTMVEMEKAAHRRVEQVIEKGISVYKTMVLQLSPRFTAHILLGGLMMIAVRVPQAIKLSNIKAAFDAVREGQIPFEVLQHAPGRDFVPYNGIDKLNYMGGGDGAKIMAQATGMQLFGKSWEEMTTTERWKAIFHMNGYLTTVIRNVQCAMVYLDALSKEPGDRFSVEDPIIGKEIEVSRQMAENKALQAVIKVFGNILEQDPLTASLTRFVFPFWHWTQHILKYVFTLPKDHPYSALILSQMGTYLTSHVGQAYDQRLQFYLFFGNPDATGNVEAVDTRYMNPFRTVGNMVTMAGFLQNLNPEIGMFLGIMSPSLSEYGHLTLYPNTTFTAQYGIKEAQTSGGMLAAFETFFPQAQAIKSLWNHTSNMRQRVTNALGLPMLDFGKINLDQLAARVEDARYEVAKTRATKAMQTGNFTLLQGYSTVPNPLNPDLQVSVTELKKLYAEGVKMNESLTTGRRLSPLIIMVPPRQVSL
jgi:hypothetical protein